MSECSICYDPVIDFPAPEATGSHRSSCGHLFHPKCIAKWHVSQDHSTCPMCRKVAVEMEDCAPEEEDDGSGEIEWEDLEDGDIILLLDGIDEILLQAGGVGMTAGVEARLRPFQRRTPRPLTEGDMVVTNRYEIDRILGEQGCNPLSDAQWTQLFVELGIMDASN